MKRELREVEITQQACDIVKAEEGVTVAHLAAVAKCSRGLAKKALEGLVPVGKCHKTRCQLGKRWINVYTSREHPRGMLGFSKVLRCIVWRVA